MLARKQFSCQLISETKNRFAYYFLLLLFLLLFSCFIFAMPAFAHEARFFIIGLHNYWLDGDSKAMDVAPFIKDGRTYVPLRYAAYAVGVSDDNVLYDDGRATIIKGDRVLQVTVGSQTMLINGIQVAMDVKPTVVGGRIMVPIYWVAKGMGVSVRWDGLLQTVVLVVEENESKPEPQPLPQAEPQPELRILEREFTWDYGGKHWIWELMIPKTAYTYYPNLKRPPTDDYSVYVTDPADDAFISNLAAQLKEAAAQEKYSPKQTVEFAIAFVQNIKYASDNISKGVKNYPRYPLETLVDQEGDCEDHSILLASILKEMGYGVVLIHIPGEHVAVGVKGSDLPGAYYEYEGARYYYVETTASGWSIGEIPNKYLWTKARILPLVPRPVLTHKWTSEGAAGGLLELKVEVRNDGSATAWATKVYAALDAGSGLVWDHRYSQPLDLVPHSMATYTLFLKLPPNVYTRLVVKIVSDGYLVDESTSDWFNT